MLSSLKFNRETISLQKGINIFLKDIDNVYIIATTSKELETNLRFKYFKYYEYFDFPNLPKEINELIHSFNYSFIEHNVIIKYPKNYPFYAPKWYFASLKSSFKNLEGCLKAFYKNKINEHNQELNNSWSSYISMEKDILYYFVSIHELTCNYL